MLDLLRTIIAYIFIALTVCVIVMNWTCMTLSLRNRRKGIDEYYSQVPLISIILIILIDTIYPHKVGMFLLLMPLYDSGTWYLIAVPFLLLNKWIRSKLKA